jgi:hypothetical protein
MLCGMANKEIARADLLLELIADELYIARTDREHANTPDSSWMKSGRNNMIQRIEELRDKLGKVFK